MINKAQGFGGPTERPDSSVQRQAWQDANRAWWEEAPMRYDWREKIEAPAGSLDYLAEIDSRFLESARHYLPRWRIPFDSLIPYESLGSADVLEIGVGHGTHAGLLAPRCRSFTGIDLTETAAAMTARRFKLGRLPGTILQMDAKHMTFPDESFDFIWSWGVIHHSADTRAILGEMRRVLRPGGRCTVMVYYRSWWHYHALGLLRGNRHSVAQRVAGWALALCDQHTAHGLVFGRADA
jgi:SAM-dependent methyltransferase